jgi:hypothetical protein
LRRSEPISLVRFVDRDDLKHAHLFFVFQNGVDSRVGPRDVHPVSVATPIDGELLLVAPTMSWVRVLGQVAEILPTNPLGFLVGDVEEFAGIVTEQDVVLRHPRGASTRRCLRPLTPETAALGLVAVAAAPVPAAVRRTFGQALSARGALSGSLRLPGCACLPT